MLSSTERSYDKMQAWLARIDNTALKVQPTTVLKCPECTRYIPVKGAAVAQDERAGLRNHMWEKHRDAYEAILDEKAKDDAAAD